MKNLVWLVILIACFSCSKEQPLLFENQESVICDNSMTAVVDYMTAEVTGEDDFYYLRIIDKGNGKEEFVYPQKLKESYKVIGTEVNLNFAFTSEIYGYIICLPGHQLDANNPEVSEMRIINICEAEKKT